MTRTVHDQFSKAYLREQLEPLGSVEVSRELPGEVRQADIFFVPGPAPGEVFERLGKLGRMASVFCLMEPFRNAVQRSDVRNCQMKLALLHGELQRQARSKRTRVPERALPHLWIIVPSCSRNLLRDFGACLAPESADWGEGFYFLPEGQKIALVVLNRLPRAPDTLWLRLLGRGETLRKAMEDLFALPPEHPLRANTLDLLHGRYIMIKEKSDSSEEEKEFAMEYDYASVGRKAREEILREGILKGRLEGRQEGRLEGRQEGRLEGRLEERRKIVEHVLKARFGVMDTTLSRTIDALLRLPEEELTEVLLHLSREELLSRFGCQTVS